MGERPADEARAVFIEGMGAASARSGVLSQLQGRIFGVLFLEDRPLSLDDIAKALQLSKSNISINIRGLVEWHLVRRVSVPNSRRDQYEAAADFWRVMQEIMERRFRWNVRQVLATIDETERAVEDERGRRDWVQFVTTRVAGLRAFFAAMDAGFGAFAHGKPLDPA